MEEDDYNSAKLFGPGVCERCGRKGVHPECAAAAAEAERKYREVEAEHLARYALHGRYGVVNQESKRSYDEARAALERRLGRKPMEDLALTVEGENWWYLPEMWIGCVGFIVEKDGGRSIAIGSGIGSITGYETAWWSGMIAYVEGRLSED